MMTNAVNALGKALRFAAWGTIGGTLGSLLAEPINLVSKQRFEASASELIVNVALWFGIIGAGIAVALLIASNQYLKRRLQIASACKNGIWIGLLAGAIAGAIAQWIYGSLGTVGESPSELIRIFCWGIAGGLLGLGLSFRVPNLGSIRGLGGGFVGGCLGGSLFVFIAIISGILETAGRLTGIAAIGFCIGLMIAIIEATFREAWLEIHYGPKESRTVSLGSYPVTLGSDAQACTVYIPNVAAIAYRYQFTQGQIFWEDIATGAKRQIQPGDQQNLGNLSLVVHAASSPSLSPKPVGQDYQPSGTINSVNQYQPSPVVSGSQSPQFSLKIQRRNQIISLVNGTCLKASEIPGLESQQTDGVVACVNRHPQDVSILGLKNCSYQVWKVTLPGSGEQQVLPGRSIRLVPGTTIDFSSVIGQVN